MKSTLYSLEIRGTIEFCPVEPPRPCGKYVFQGVKPGLGNVPNRKHKDLQLRRHVIPFDPKTPQQIMRRTAFRIAIYEWRALPLAQQIQWHEFGRGSRLPGYNRFLSWRLRGI